MTGNVTPLEYRITDNVVVDPMSGCWLWQRSTDTRGYGHLWVDFGHGKVSRQAPRLAWELFRGPIPTGMVIRHRCGVKRCCNVDHLEVLTARENVTHPESRSFSSLNAEKSHCPDGHPYSGVNNRGGRVCATCQRASDRRSRERKAAAAAAVDSAEVEAAAAVAAAAAAAGPAS